MWWSRSGRIPAVPKTEEMIPALRGTVSRRALAEAVAFLILAAISAGSAILMKESRRTPMPMMMMSHADPLPRAAIEQPGRIVHTAMTSPADPRTTELSASTQTQPQPQTKTPGFDLSTRWFHGRPIRPARVIRMRVTAYSPDHRSCGEFADGKTATMHSVETNGGALVAADPRLLPYGSMLTVPGYDDDLVVPVLDCGGAIKGNRLDLLFPTHEQACVWGVKDLDIVVWEYADDLPPADPRKLR